jgi:hypothetical protein
MITTLLLAGSFDLFMPDLAREYYLTKTSRAIELTHHVRVQKFGPLGQWTSPDAIATYNPLTNTISLNEDMLRGDVVKPAREIMGPLGNYSKISTIFHEMGHAEMDVFVENQREPEDAALKYHYDSKLKDFYKKHFPSFNSHTVYQEHFGYYRADLIEYFSAEMNEVLLQNGFNKFKNSCFLTGQLKMLLAQGMSLEDFQKLQIFGGAEEMYRLKVGPKFIFVKGKDLDLSSVPAAMIRETHDRFWSYHQAFYGFPMSRKDLVNRMNKSASYMKVLSECRAKFWNENQGH